MMLDRLVKDAASRFHIESDRVGRLLDGLLQLMIDEQVGGVEGFLGRFRRLGPAGPVDSWLATRPNRPLGEVEVRSALNEDVLEDLSERAELGRGTAVALLAYLIPRLVDELSPRGTPPTTAELRARVRPRLRRRSRARSSRGGRRPAVVALFTSGAVVLGALAVAGWLVLGPGEGSREPMLAVSNAGPEVTYSGMVRDEEARATIVEALNSAFGEERLSGELSVDSEVKDAAWIPRVDAVLSALDRPGAELTLTGDSARVGGRLSEREWSAVTERVRGALAGRVSVVEAEPADEAGGAASRTTAALARLDSLAAAGPGSAGAEPLELVEALNLGFIEFEGGSARPTALARVLLDRAAGALDRLPEGTRIVVVGRGEAFEDPAAEPAADPATEPAADPELGEARARAVVEALVEAGADPAVLVARGYEEDGRTRTPERPIEFRLLDSPR